MWKYNGKIYSDKKEMLESLGWSRTKWKHKVQDGKVVKVE